MARRTINDQQIIIQSLKSSLRCTEVIPSSFWNTAPHHNFENFIPLSRDVSFNLFGTYELHGILKHNSNPVIITEWLPQPVVPFCKHGWLFGSPHNTYIVYNDECIPIRFFQIYISHSVEFLNWKKNSKGVCPYLPIPPLSDILSFIKENMDMCKQKLQSQ